ncbi:hypothetical protein WAK64_19660 [Bacillus spongiae]|uniref:Uncharacterized protein n=1 Tax=Bacillus spongiae TaxID=2683610 RepID=A0ABU8HJ05_9BACI
MNKAMFQAHGISYEKYLSCFSTRLRIERKMDQEYQTMNAYLSRILLPSIDQQTRKEIKD